MFEFQYVKQQYHVHQQRVDNGRDSHLSTVEDKWGGGNGDGLCRILHTYLDDDGAAHSIRQLAYSRKQRAAGHACQDEQTSCHTYQSEIVDNLLGILQEKQ